ncbi:MAG: hypothetical protein K2H85_05060 [Allobaculum sp.]|nr:hypothetical protein [Allobaculum sp.]
MAKLIILFCCTLTALTASAMKYQIKVLNTPTITIDNKETKVGDWFDDASVISWSKDNQAMRVLSEDNKVYTLSAKLYKESQAKKFADFIAYTKPLASRGPSDDNLITQLQERFSNYFVMLDETVIDLSDLDLSEDCCFRFVNKDADLNDSIRFAVIPKDKNIQIDRAFIAPEHFVKEQTLVFIVTYISSIQSETLSEDFEIEVLPLEEM